MATDRARLSGRVPRPYVCVRDNVRPTGYHLYVRTRYLAAVLVAASLFGACSGDDEAPQVVVPPTATSTTSGTETATPVPPVPSSEPITAPFELPVVMYHDVSDLPPDDIYRAASNVLPADFSAQLDYLQCAGYTTITMSQLFEAIEGRGALPEKAIVLTFDDGYGDHYTQAFPILKQHGMTGAFAIITGYVQGGGDYVTWAQIKEMSDAGMEMMSHTQTHLDLNTSDGGSVEEQLRGSRAALEEHTGRPVEFFVYPSGEPFRSGTEERQAQVVSMLEEAGYHGALLAGPSSMTQDPAQPFALNRLRVGEGTDLGTFAALVGGPAPEACAE